MEDVTIESLIAQRKVVKTADLSNPNNDYMIVGVYQNGTNKSKGDGTSYKNYVISIAELLGGGSTYTGSNGIILVGNDFQFASQDISQFINDSGYITSAWLPDGNTFGVERYIGTDDNFGLPFRTNNTEVARFDTLGNFGVGSGIINPTARVQIKGVSATLADYALRIDNSAVTSLFYVRNDGMVNSDNGYSINNVRRFWTDPTLNIVGWNHTTASPLTLGSGSRNVIFGNSDSNQPQFTTGGFNAVFGTFSNMGITSGAYNLVLGNYNVNTPTIGNKNIIFGQAGMLATGKDETLTFNGYSNNSNQVVFGSENYAKYQDWYFGRGMEADQASVGSFQMNWYATNATAGVLDRAAVVTAWRFNAGRGTGTGAGSEFLWRVAPIGISGSTNNALADAMRIGSEGKISMYLLPTSNVGLVSGDLWNNLGIINIV